MLSWARIGLTSSFGAPLVGGCDARAVSRDTPIFFIKQAVGKTKSDQEDFYGASLGVTKLKEQISLLSENPTLLVSHQLSSTFPSVTLSK